MSANSHENKKQSDHGRQCASHDFKEYIPVLFVLFAGIILVSILLAWWRRSSDVPGIERRLALPSEAANFIADTSTTEEPVRIGERFKKFNGIPATQAGSWPRFRGVNYDNVSTESIKLAENWPERGPAVVWSAELGEGYAGPVILNGCTYILDYDNKEDADSLRCFSMEDGKEIWRRWYHVHIKRNHGMSRTVPAVTEHHIVSIGPRCHVMCCDARSGDLKWGIDLEKDWGTVVPMWYAGQCALIDDDQVVIGVGGKALLMGVECETGRVLWQTPNPKKWQMSHSSVIPMTIGGQKIYVYCAIGGMVGVSAEKETRGRIVWETEEWNHQVVAPSPVYLGDGKIFITSGYGVGSAMFKVSEEAGNYAVKQLYKLDKNIFACEQHTPVFYKGYLYTVLPADAGSAKRQAVCMNPDGKVVWSSGPADKFGLGPFMIADNKMLILEDNGLLTMIKATEQGYFKLAQAKVLEGKESWAPMALADGRLLVRDYGRMKCLDLR